MKAISDGQQFALGQVWDAVDQALNDQFVDTASEYGLGRLEKILSIIPKGTDSLDARRFRVKTRINEQLPYTLPALKNQLATICGENGYSVTIGQGTYILTVRVELISKGNLDDVNTMLQRVVPAEIVIDLDLKYNSFEVLSGFTHAELSAYTHEQIRSEVLSHA